MPRIFAPVLATVAAVAIFAVACGDDSGSRRVINVKIAADACSPDSIDLKTGEDVTFAVKNESSDDREFEGINGTKISEVIVPAGRTRNIDYNAPGQAGTATVKCYIPGGKTTLITLNVSGSATGGDAKEPGAAEDNSRKTDKAPNATINVKLVSFEVTADKPSVKAGPTKFVATNASPKDVHELAVLRVKDDGKFENTGEVEDIDPGKSGEVVLDLPKGRYVLACLITPGEEGSTVDHFKQGMRLDFEVN